MVASDNNIKNDNHTYVPKILLVEDDFISQKINKLMLVEIGCQVDTAETGEQALNLFSTYKYDLVFLDIGLPDISGIRVCEIIRQQEQYKNIPIIALTTHSERLADECLQSGMDSFSTKPISVYEMERIISNLGLAKQVS